MFETASGPDAWMIDRYAGAASHPITSSVFSTICDALPNDTGPRRCSRSAVSRGSISPTSPIRRTTTRRWTTSKAPRRPACSTMATTPWRRCAGPGRGGSRESRRRARRCSSTCSAGGGAVAGGDVADPGDRGAGAGDPGGGAGAAARGAEWAAPAGAGWASACSASWAWCWRRGWWRSGLARGLFAGLLLPLGGASGAAADGVLAAADGDRAGGRRDALAARRDGGYLGRGVDRLGGRRDRPGGRWRRACCRTCSWCRRRWRRASPG